MIAFPVFLRRVAIATIVAGSVAIFYVTLVLSNQSPSTVEIKKRNTTMDHTEQFWVSNGTWYLNNHQRRKRD